MVALQTTEPASARPVVATSSSPLPAVSPHLPPAPVPAPTSAPNSSAGDPHNPLNFVTGPLPFKFSPSMIESQLGAMARLALEVFSLRIIAICPFLASQVDQAKPLSTSLQYAHCYEPGQAAFVSS